MFSPLTSQVLGKDHSILVLRLPSMVTDEQVTPIRDEIRARLPRQSGAGLILDFEGVELVNSIGITCLLQVEEDCRRQHARLILATVPAPIFQFLRQVRLDRRFRCLPTLDEALAVLEEPPTTTLALAAPASGEWLRSRACHGPLLRLSPLTCQEHDTRQDQDDREGFP